MHVADKKNYLYLGLLIGMIIIATVISSDFSKDSSSYNQMFNMYGASAWGGLPVEMSQREPFLVVA
jgi:hypothetical protein